MKNRTKKIAMLLSAVMLINSIDGSMLISAADEVRTNTEILEEEVQMQEDESVEEQKLANEEVEDTVSEEEIAEDQDLTEELLEENVEDSEVEEQLIDQPEIAVQESTDDDDTIYESDDEQDAFTVVSYTDDMTVHPGEGVTVSVEVEKHKDVEIFYQWYVEKENGNWDPIQGATEESYTIPSIQKSMSLKCVIKDAEESTMDNVYVDIKVNSGLKINTEKTKFIVSPFENLVLSVDASTEYGHLSYRWRRAGFDEELSKDQTLTVEAKNEVYRCEVSDGYNKLTYTCEVLVDSGFSINNYQVRLSGKVGDRIMLSADAESDYELTYQWEKQIYVSEYQTRWVTIDGATSAEYQTDPLETETSKSWVTYCCSVSDGYNSESIFYSIKVDRGFHVENKNQAIYVDPDSSVRLSVEATTEEGTLTYAWYDADQYKSYYPEQNILGTSAVLEIPNVTKSTKYMCIVSNGYDTETVYRGVVLTNGFSVKGGGEKWILPGESTELSVEAHSGAGEITYEWNKEYIYDEEDDEDDVEDAEESSITVNKPGKYTCEVSDGVSSKFVRFLVEMNDGFEVINDGETVKVKSGYKSKIMNTISVKTGEVITLQSGARSTYGKLTYEWYKNGKRLEGENTAELVTTAITESEKGDLYACFIENKTEVSQKAIEIQWYVNTKEKKAELTVEAPEHVAVSEDGKATLSVNVRNAASEHLTYCWQLCDDLGGATDLSKKAMINVYNINRIEQYRCTVSDGISEQSVEMYVGPQEDLDLCTEDYAHAKTLPVNGTARAKSAERGGYNKRGYAYFKFVPDRTGTWNISSENGQNYDGVLITSRENVLATDYVSIMDNNISLTADLIAGEIYYVLCGVELWDYVDVTLHAKYLGEGEHEHVWDTGVVTKQPGCLENGVKTYTCIYCDETKTEAIPATGKHVMEIVVDRVATCGTEGSQHMECSICHTKEAAVTIPANGNHRFGDYVIVAQPTALADGIKARTCNVCGQKESISVSRLKGTMNLTKNALTLKGKSTIQLSGMVTGMANGDYITSYVSDNIKVATVDVNGVVTVKTAGKANIRITLASGVSDEVKITVQQAATTKLKVSSTVKLSAGQKKKLAVTVTPKYATDVVTYTSANKKIATVSSDGTITAKKAGKTKITVKSGKKKATITVTVTKKAPTGIQGIQAKATLKKGKTLTLKAKLVPTGAEAKIKYKSSNKKVATVDSKGRVKAKKAGTAVITVTAGKVKTTCEVTVK